MKFKKIYLNEKAIDFVSEQLKFNSSLDDTFTKLISNSKLEIWGFFTRELSEKELVEFEYGGKFVENTRNEVTDIILKYLEKDFRNRWVLIDNNGDINYAPGKNAIENVTTVFFFENIVFHILPWKLVSKANIIETFKFGGWYPFIGFITKATVDIEGKMVRNIVDENDMETLIEDISLMIIGAYDEEGYLIVEIK